jgi:broad specificity phosphatase PhoE
MKVILCAGMLFFFITIAPTFAEEDFSTTRLLYIRHGEVPGNDPNPAIYIYTGSGTDDSLTEKGKTQAEKCAKTISSLQKSGVLGNITAIYASDLKRAIETSKPIAEELGLSVYLRHDLREISWGCADGQLVKKMTEEWKAAEHQIHQQYPDRKIRWDYLPVFESAETYNALLSRNIKELQTIGETHKGQTVLIVGHGRVLKTLIADARDSEEKIPYPANCGIAEFIYSSDEGLSFVKVFEESDLVK